MANIGNLVDRTYREYLEPMDDIVSYTTLSTGINDSVTSVVFNGDLLSVEEEDALDAGAIIEIGQELMICTDLNAVTNTITVTRGARGTTKIAHTAGDLIKIGDYKTLSKKILDYTSRNNKYKNKLKKKINFGYQNLDRFDYYLNMKKYYNLIKKHY